MENQTNPNNTFQQFSESCNVENSLHTQISVSAADGMEQNKTKAKKQVRKVIILLALRFLLPEVAFIIPLVKSLSITDAVIYSATTFLTSVITLALTTLIMIAIPISCRLINRNRFSYKVGNWLCAGNSLVLLILSIILRIRDATLVSIDAFIYFFVNKWLFVEIDPDNDKQTGKALVLLFLLWMSYYGQSAETTLNVMSATGRRAQLSVSDSFSETMIVANFTSILALCCAALVFMAVPALCRIIHKDKLPLKGGKWICAGNSLFLLILSTLLGFGGGGIEAIFFYFINKWFFVNSKRHSADITERYEEDNAEPDNE